MAGGRQLTVTLVANTKSFGRGMTDAVRSAEGFKGKMQAIGSSLSSIAGPALAGAAAAAGAFAIKLGIDGVKAAAADQQAAEKLAQTLRNLGMAQDDAKIEDFIFKLQMQTGVVDDQLRPAYDRLIRSTRDVSTAESALQLALDISAGKGKDLSLVANALGKAYDGNTNALGRLGLGIDSSLLKSKDMTAITADLSKLFAGQAAAAANTWTGKVQRLSVAFDELKESFGTGFLNSLDSASSSIDGIQQTMIDLRPAAETLGQTIGDLVYVISGLSKVVSIGQTAWNWLPGWAQEVGKFAYGAIDPLFKVGQLLFTVGQASAASNQSMDQTIDRVRIMESNMDSSAKSVAAMNRQAANAGPVIFKLGDSAAVSTDKFDLLRAEMNRTIGTLDILAGAFDTANAAMAQRQAMQDYKDALKAFVEDPNEATRDAAVKANMDWAQSFKDPQKQAQITAQGYGEITAAAQDAGVKVPGWMKAMGDAAAAQQDPVAKLKQLMEEIPTNIQSQIAMHVTLNGKYYDPYGAYDSSTKKPATGGPFATGGYVRAALGTHASDNIPAMLSRGEYVLNADTVRRLGVGTLNGLNNGGSMGGSGVMIQQLNVQSAAGERAEESVPRALRRLAFVAGLNG